MAVMHPYLPPFFRILPVLAATLAMPLQAAEPPVPFKAAHCEGSYPRHVQGICTNGGDAIYWSWTEALVKTDLNGKILTQVPAPDHQGDPCYLDGKLYVAVNLGKFNKPAGEASSWVFVYDGETLAELSRHPVPELVHGAGGMAWREGHFFIVGGLPPGTEENYVYEYDSGLKFIRRHVLASGYTLMGIQTAEYADGSWWFGCYGKPEVLLRADDSFKITGRWNINAAVGLTRIAPGRFLLATNKGSKETGNTAQVRLAHADEARGLVIDD